MIAGVIEELVLLSRHVLVASLVMVSESRVSFKYSLT